MCVGKVSSVTKLDVPLRTIKKTDNFKNANKLQYQEDILAIFTYYTKIILFAIGDYLKCLQNSAFLKILMRTTQPAHLVTAFSVIVVSYLMLPRETKVSSISPVWNLVYLASFSAHFGAQIWMTFVSGLSLYFSLSRHAFGNVQQVLFPKYFLLNAVLSLITLSVFLKANNSNFKNAEVSVQAAAMILCFLIELGIRLYLTNPLLRLIAIKTKIEKAAGVGLEVGKLNAGNLLNCPHYMAIHNSFRKVHMTIAIGNITCMACTILHLVYLSQKMCFL